MKKLIRQKVVGMVIGGTFFVLLNVLLWFIAILTGAISMYVASILATVLSFYELFNGLSEIKLIKIMYPIGEQFNHDIESRGYQFLCFDYPSRHTCPPKAKGVDLWITVYDSNPRLVAFYEVESPYPQRYEFYKSLLTNPEYLYVLDLWGYKRYLLKK